MHFLGVLVQVHFEAKRQGLRGLTAEELPKHPGGAEARLADAHPAVRAGRRPAQRQHALSGRLLGHHRLRRSIGFLNPRRRLTPLDRLRGLRPRRKYALAVGAAAATVGIVIGVVTLTGVSFKISYIVTSTAAGWAESTVRRSFPST